MKHWDSLRSRDEFSHNYKTVNRIIQSDVPGVTKDMVFDSLVRYPSIGADRPATHFGKVKLIGLKAKNPINTTIDPQNYSVVNYTEPGHGLYGTVTRNLRENDGWYEIETIGKGNNPNEDWEGWVTERWNEVLGPVLFAVNSQGEIRPDVLDKLEKLRVQHYAPSTFRSDFKSNRKGFFRVQTHKNCFQLLANMIHGFQHRRPQ